MRVSIGSLYLNNGIISVQDRYIESTTAQIENNDVLPIDIILSLSEGNCSSSRLINNSEYLEPCYLGGINGGPPLAIIEISRHRNNCLLDFATSNILLRLLLQLRQDHSQHLFWKEQLLLPQVVHLDLRPVSRARHHLERKLLAVFLYVGVAKFAANQALRVKNRVLRVLSRLFHGALADEPSLTVEGDDGGRDILADVIFDDFDFAVLPNTHSRKSRAQINTDGVLTTQIRNLVNHVFSGCLKNGECF